MMSRLPIRWKITLAFALASTIVLAAVGVFLYARLSADLDNTIESDLRMRADHLHELINQQQLTELPTTQAEELESDETIAQILTPTGGVVAANAYADVRLLSPAQLRAAVSGELFFDRPGDAAIDESLRIFARPAFARGETFIVVVTDSLDERAQTLASTLGVEIVALAAALVASCGVGYWVSGLALRPVEDLRQRADAISGDDLADAKRAPLPVSPVADEIGRLGRTLNDMLDRIGRAQAAQHDALEQQRRFLADASHQLRTPLSIIKAEVELAQSGTTQGDDLRAAMASVGEETDRLSGLTQQLLLLAAADEERLSLSRGPVKLGDLLQDVAERAQSRAQLQGRMITVEADASIISADWQRLEYALGNLVDNALTHGAGDMELIAKRDGDVVKVQVRDHGAGFSDSYLAHPFDRFAPAASTGRGSGLGLAIVQAITEAHGGVVTLANEYGATVTISLPINPTRPDQDRHRTGAQIVQGEALELFVAVPRYLEPRGGGHVVGVPAKISNESAIVTQIATQRIAHNQRCRIIGGDAARRSRSDGSELLGEPPAKGGCCPATAVDNQCADQHQTNSDLRRSSSHQVDQAADRCTNGECHWSCGEAGEMRKPGRRDKQERPLPQHQQHRQSGLLIAPGKRCAAKQRNHCGDRYCAWVGAAHDAEAGDLIQPIKDGSIVTPAPE
jgi:two-component system, OmpR family, sensor kinase